MALSDYERKMLEELEAQLSNEDPGFADTLQKKETRQSYAHQVSIRHIVLGILILLAGIGVLLAGVQTEIILVGVLGIVIMAVGGWYMSLGITSELVERDVEVRDRPKTSPRGANPLQDFMTRQMEEWEKRRREGNG